MIQFMGAGQFMDATTGELVNFFSFRATQTGKVVQISVDKESFEAVLALRGEELPQESPPEEMPHVGQIRDTSPADFDPRPLTARATESTPSGEEFDFDEESLVEGLALGELPFDTGEMAR